MRSRMSGAMANREPADVLGVEPEGFGVEGFFRCRRGLFEIHHGVGAIDAFEREGIGKFLKGHLVTIVFWRPAEQAQKVDEGLRKEAGIAVSGDADYGTVAALRELRSVGRDQQRKMRELRRLDAGRLPSRCKDQDRSEERR